MRKILSLISLAPLVVTSCGSEGPSKVPDLPEGSSFLDAFTEMNDLTLELPDSVSNFRALKTEYIQTANFGYNSYSLEEDDIDNNSLKSQTFENTRATAPHLSLNSKIIQTASKYIGNNWRQILSGKDVQTDNSDPLLRIDNVITKVRDDNDNDNVCFNIEGKLVLSSVMPTAIDYCVKDRKIIAKIDIDISGFAQDRVFKRAKFLGETNIDYYFIGSLSSETNLLESAYVATTMTGNEVFSAEIKKQDGKNVISSGTKVRANNNGSWEYFENSSIAMFDEGNLFGVLHRPIDSAYYEYEDDVIDVADSKGNRILESQKNNRIGSSWKELITRIFPSGLTNWNRMYVSNCSSCGSSYDISLHYDNNGYKTFRTGRSIYGSGSPTTAYSNYRIKNSFENEHGEIISSQTYYPSLLLTTGEGSSNWLKIPSAAIVKLMPFNTDNISTIRDMVDVVTVDGMGMNEKEWMTKAYQGDKNYIDLI